MWPKGASKSKARPRGGKTQHGAWCVRRDLNSDHEVARAGDEARNPNFPGHFGPNQRGKGAEFWDGTIQDILHKSGTEMAMKAV